MRSAPIGLVALALVAAITATPSTAHACSIVTGCEYISVSPSKGVSVPANAAGVVVEKVSVPSWATLSGSLSESPSGNAVSTQVESRADYWLVRFLDPVTVGSAYALSVKSECADSGSDVSNQTASFSVGSASALPTLTGSLGVTHVYDASNPLHVVRLAITPSADLAAFLPITRFRTFVDGREWAKGRFGAGPSDPYASDSPFNGWSFTRLYAYCDGGIMTNSCSGSTLSPQPHDIEIFAEVAGLATQPASIKMTVDLSCPPTADGDAGPGAVTHVYPNDSSDASSAQSSTPAPSAPRPQPPLPQAANSAGDAPIAAGGGCAVFESRDSASHALALIAALGLALRRLRRRVDSRSDA